MVKLFDNFFEELQKQIVRKSKYDRALEDEKAVYQTRLSDIVLLDHFMELFVEKAFSPKENAPGYGTQRSEVQKVGDEFRLRLMEKTHKAVNFLRNSDPLAGFCFVRFDPEILNSIEYNKDLYDFPDSKEVLAAPLHFLITGVNRMSFWEGRLDKMERRAFDERQEDLVLEFWKGVNALPKVGEQVIYRNMHEGKDVEYKIDPEFKGYLLPDFHA